MRLAVVAAAALAFASFAIPRASSLAPSAVDGRARGPVVPIVVHDGAPYLELVFAGGARGTFLLDTGANGSAVDGAWLRSNRLASTPAGHASVLGTTGALSVPRVALERLDLGTRSFLGPVFNVQSFGGFARPGGRPQAGLIGTDFLNHYWLRLDYAAHVAELALPAEKRAPPRSWSTLSVVYDHDLPTIDVRLGPVALPCRLDTGASYFDRDAFLDVNRAALDAVSCAGVPLRARGAIHVLGASGPETLPLFETPVPLSIGTKRMGPVVLVVHDTGTLARAAPLALAGAPILSRLERFVLDPFERAFHVPSVGGP